MKEYSKILHIIDSMGLGGAQTLIKSIFENQKNNTNIFLFALRKRDITIEVDHENVIINNSTHKYNLGALKRLKSVIKKEKIEVLHCHLFKSNIFGLLLKIMWFPNIKLIIHEHGEILQGHLLYNAFFYIFSGYFDKVVAVSETTKTVLISKGVDPKKIFILANAVDLAKFQNAKQEDRSALKNGDFIIGYVGRLDKIKGCEYLIKALPLIKFDFKVLIVGEGSEKSNLLKLVEKLGLTDRISFLGYRNNLEKWYHLFDVLVVPSLSESFGLTVIEGQISQVPVIASNIPAIRALIRDKYTGLLFEVMNHEDLYKKILEIHDNLELKKKIQLHGYENALQYGFDGYIKNLINIYVFK